MSQDMEQIDIDLLLSRILQGNASKDEVQFFSEWLKDYRNEVYFDKYKELWHTAINDAYVANNQSLDKDRFVGYIRNTLKRERRKKVLTITYSIAASVVLLIGAMYLTGLYNIVFVDKQDFRALNYSRDSVRIELDNGKIVKRVKGAQRFITSLDGSVAKGVEDSLKVRGKESKDKIYNTVYTPAGERVAMLLSDGTKVYLTSNSYLRYPVSFEKSRREVTLVGRAYFEVKKSEVPFIVKTSDMNVEVLGTSFDVESRIAKENVSVILVEGSVKVQAEGQTAIIHPDEQINFSRKDKVMSVKRVDSKMLTMWKEGVLIVDGQTFDELLENLASWYGVQIVNESNVSKSEKYNGRFDREDIEAAIKAICISANTKYIIDDGKLILRND